MSAGMVGPRLLELLPPCRTMHATNVDHHTKSASRSTETSPVIQFWGPACFRLGTHSHAFLCPASSAMFLRARSLNNARHSLHASMVS